VIHINPIGGSAERIYGVTFGANNTTMNYNAQAGLYVQSSGSYGTKLSLATTNNFGTGAQTRLLIDAAGNVGIGTTTPWRRLSVTGTVGFDGLTGSTGAGSLCLTASKEAVYNSGSDACLPSLRDTKHDISSLSLDALQIVDALDPVSFVYNDGDGHTRYGFIADPCSGSGICSGNQYRR
jgi:hypothetical protein